MVCVRKNPVTINMLHMYILLQGSVELGGLSSSGVPAGGTEVKTEPVNTLVSVMGEPSQEVVFLYSAVLAIFSLLGIHQMITVLFGL